MTKSELLEAINTVLTKIEHAQDLDDLNCLGLKAHGYVTRGKEPAGMGLALREANELSMTISRKIALRQAEILAESE